LPCHDDHIVSSSHWYHSHGALVGRIQILIAPGV
jgi:hypothetical protein